MLIRSGNCWVVKWNGLVVGPRFDSRIGALEYQDALRAGREPLISTRNPVHAKYRRYTTFGGFDRG